MERETVVEIVVAVVAVLLFIGFVIAVGTAYGEDGLSPTGGQALVAGIALFILVMAGTGYWLSTQEF